MGSAIERASRREQLRHANNLSVVMAGLGPAIHVFGATAKQDVDARDKPGHDVERSAPD